MKEKDYLDTMRHIRREYIDEALRWDGAERRRSRMIRRMTLGIGAIAAAIAVAVGVIAYGARDRNLRIANSELLQDSEQNFLGGYGELKPYIGYGSAVILCDRSRTYFQFNQKEPTAYAGADNKIMFLPENCHILSDGERMYKADGLTLSVIDSSGKTSDFFTLTEDCPAYSLAKDDALFSFGSLRHLSGDYYAISYSSALDSLGPYRTVIYDAAQKRVIASCHTAESSPNVRADADGSGWYARTQENVTEAILKHPYSAPSQYEYILETAPDINDSEYIDAWTVSGSKLCYLISDPSASGIACFQYDMQSGETKELFRSDTFDKRWLIGRDALYQISFEDGFEVYTEMTFDGTDGREIFRAPAEKVFPGDSYTYRMTQNYEFIKADGVIFAISQIYGTEDTIRIIRINTEDGSYQLLTAADQTVREEERPSEGYVTESEGDLSVYYIPPEHVADGLGEVQCCRMLPIRDAAHSALDSDAIVASLPLMGNCWNEEFDPDALDGLNAQMIRDLADESEDILDFETKLNNLTTWACAWGSGVVRCEYWLDAQGRELVLTSSLGTYLLQFDEDAGQYHYEMLPVQARNQSTGTGTSGTADAVHTEITQTTAAAAGTVITGGLGLNELGGHGKLRYFNADSIMVNAGYLWDDEYIYDIAGESRAKAAIGELEFTPLCTQEGCKHNSEDCPVHILRGKLLDFGSGFRQNGDFTLNRINPDGSETELLTVSQDNSGKRFHYVIYDTVRPLCGGSILYISLTGEFLNPDNSVNPYQQIDLLYRVSDGSVTVLADQPMPLSKLSEDCVNWGYCAPAYDDDTALWTTHYTEQTMQLMRIDAQTGARTYYDLPKLDYDQWTVMGGHFYYRSTDDKWISYDLSTKEEQIICDFPMPSITDLDFSDCEGMILIQDNAGTIYAYDRTLSRRETVFRSSTDIATLYAVHVENGICTGLANIGADRYALFSFTPFT